MKDTLFLIRTNEDGEVYLSKVTSAEVLAELEEGELDGKSFLRYLQKTIKLSEIEGCVLIRGEIVAPKEITVVTSWEL